MEAPQPVTITGSATLIPSHSLTSNAHRAKHSPRTPSPLSMTFAVPPPPPYNTALLDTSYASPNPKSPMASTNDSNLRSGAYQGELAERTRLARGGQDLWVNTLHQRGIYPDELSPLPYPPGARISPSAFPEGGYQSAQPIFSPDSPTRSKYRDARPLPYFLRLLWPTSFVKRLRSMPDSPWIWMSMYFCLNLSLTLYNKSVLIKFPFPYTLTAIHALCGSIGTYIWLRFSQRGPPASVSTAPLASSPPSDSNGIPILSGPELVVLFLFSILYTINIAVSNASLGLVTVPFHQVVRSSTPLFTIVLAAVLVGKKCSRQKLLALVPVVAGVGLATYGDYYFTILGFFLTLLGTVLAAAKTVVTNIILIKPSATTALPTSTDGHMHPSLQQAPPYSPTTPLSGDWKAYPSPHVRHSSPVPPSGTSGGSMIPPNFFSALLNVAIKRFFPPSPNSSPIYSYKPLTSASDHASVLSTARSGGLFSFPKLSLSPLHLLYLLSPLAFVQTTLIAHFTGELDRARYYLAQNGGHQRTFLLLNGVLAFFLNVVSFNANKKVGPVGMSVAGNVKQVLTVLCAVVIFDLTISPANGLGIFLTLVGGALYAMVEIQERKNVKSRIV